MGPQETGNSGSPGDPKQWAPKRPKTVGPQETQNSGPQETQNIFNRRLPRSPLPFSCWSCVVPAVCPARQQLQVVRLSVLSVNTLLLWRWAHQTCPPKKVGTLALQIWLKTVSVSFYPCTLILVGSKPLVHSIATSDMCTICHPSPGCSDVWSSTSASDPSNTLVHIITRTWHKSSEIWIESSSGKSNISLVRQPYSCHSKIKCSIFPRHLIKRRRFTRTDF